MTIYRCRCMSRYIGVTALQARPMTLPVLTVLLALAALAGGCAAITAPGNPPAAAEVAAAQAAADAARTAALEVQSGQEPRYLRLKAEDTQLVAAYDDGRITYLSFSAPVTGPLEVFDQQGRALAVAIAARIVAVEGVHAGILVRRAEQSSFISPNPRALSLPQRPMPASPEYREARARLENQSGQLQAMQKALAAASRIASPDGAAGRPASSSSSAGLLQVSASPPATLPGSWPLRPINTPPSPTLPSPTPSRSPYQTEEREPLVPIPPLPGLLRKDRVALAVPLAAANASASSPERGLVRIFFATASRAIVAPDDGLGLLLRETARADQIRVTGYTDATGSRASNDALALARVEAVVQILLRRGVPPARIFSNAVGADDFIADNDTDRGRALNRRVEVLLMRDGAPLSFESIGRGAR